MRLRFCSGTTVLSQHGTGAKASTGHWQVESVRTIHFESFSEEIELSGIPGPVFQAFHDSLNHVRAKCDMYVSVRMVVEEGVGEGWFDYCSRNIESHMGLVCSCCSLTQNPKL